MNNLTDIKQLSKKSLLKLIDKANKIKASSDKKNSKILKGRSIANIFFENSTRTLVSFELAAKKLGAHVVNVNIAKSSTVKGETLKDTLQTLAAMSFDAFVIRHSQAFIFEEIKTWLPKHISLINAGDGNNQHPTQALLDIYTMLQYKNNIEQRKIAIIGDIKHSRVANSLVDALHILGNKNIHLFGPQQLLPAAHSKAMICHDIKKCLKDCDIVVMLRIQKERIQNHDIPNLDQYHEKFGLNQDNLRLCKTDCIIMHPGPINRGVEITSEIAESQSSVILEQVTNGVLLRQAVLAKLMG